MIPPLDKFIDEILPQSRGKPLSTFDLKRLAEKYAGKPLDWFFDRLGLRDGNSVVRRDVQGGVRRQTVS